MTNTSTAVIAGVDTHADTHHVAVLDAATGGLLGDAQFPATATGYGDLAAFVTSRGRVLRMGIEGTNSYGAGLARHLRAAGITVVEVIRPKREQRRRGKSDPIDAVAAARETLAHDDLPTPKSSDGTVESIRVLLRIRESAVRARAAAIQQIKSILVTAPQPVRDKYSTLSDTRLITVLADTRPVCAAASPAAATTVALRRLARRHKQLNNEIDSTTAELEGLIEAVAPALLAANGIGVVTAAQLLITAGDNPDRITGQAAFAALCGVAPIPASSGKTTRHRLNRGGDRQANRALHQIALVRMKCDQRTRSYIAKKRAEGKSTREAMRCLKRAIAREIYRLLTNPPTIAPVDDLRTARQAHGWTLKTVADHFGVSPAHISSIERGTRHNATFADAYRRWITAA